MVNILLATNNIHKIKEIMEILSEYKGAIKSLQDFPPFPEPLEDGSTYRENAIKKAHHYYKLTNLSTLSDDSGLEIDAFDGKPGIYSARFIDPSLSFDERNRIVLEMMNEVPWEKRGARFISCCVLFRSENDIKVEYGMLEGKIGYEKKGGFGFGYDPIFYLPDKKLYLAELTPDEKNKISHRYKAFSKMEESL